MTTDAYAWDRSVSKHKKEHVGHGRRRKGSLFSFLANGNECESPDAYFEGGDTRRTLSLRSDAAASQVEVHTPPKVPEMSSRMKGIIQRIKKNLFQRKERQRKGDARDSPLVVAALAESKHRERKLNEADSSDEQFGVPIQDLKRVRVRRYRCRIPRIIVLLRDLLYASDGLQTEGVFRSTPHPVEIERLRREVCEGHITKEPTSAHVFSELLKEWYNRLPVRVLDHLLTEPALHSNDELDVGPIIEHMDEPYKSVFLFLLDVLIETYKHKDKNKVSQASLACVVAPSLYTFDDYQIKMFGEGEVNLPRRMMQFLNLSISYRRSQLLRELWSPSTERDDAVNEVDLDSVLSYDEI